MVAWSVELSKFTIKYEPKGPIKIQCLADFIFELREGYNEEEFIRGGNVRQEWGRSKNSVTR